MDDLARRRLTTRATDTRRALTDRAHKLARDASAYAAALDAGRDPGTGAYRMAQDVLEMALLEAQAAARAEDIDLTTPTEETETP